MDKCLKLISFSVQPEFYLAGNPFECTCEMQWIKTDLASPSLPAFPDLDNVTCLINHNGNVTLDVAIQSVDPIQFLCQYESHCFSLCMCCDFYGCDCRMQCPEGCSCFHDSSWSSNIIQCSARGHSAIPPLIPMDATSVFLDGNNFRNLSEKIFLGRSRMKSLYLNRSQIVEVSNSTFSGLVDLQQLDLSDNNILSLQGSEFQELFNLKELYLHRNKLMFISEGTFRPLKALSVLRIDQNLLKTFPIWEMSSNNFLMEMYISENFWTCDCNFFNKMRMFIDGNSEIVMDSGYVRCKSENYLIENPKKFCIENLAASSSALSDGNIIFLALGCGFCLVFVVVMVVSLRSRDRIKNAFYLCQFKTFHKEPANIGKYDVFMSYSLKDELVATKLEQRLSKLRVCMQHGDLGKRSQQSVMNKAELIIFIASQNSVREDTIKTLKLKQTPEYGRVVAVNIENCNLQIPQCLEKSIVSLDWQDVRFWDKLFHHVDTIISSKINLLMDQVHSPDITTTDQPSIVDSLRFKTRSRQTINATLDSKNEFIYLTPKPKKSRCQPGEVGHGDLFHQRSHSELAKQRSDATIYHQRSRSSALVDYAYDPKFIPNTFQNQSPAEAVLTASRTSVNPATSSNSFINKLISSSDSPQLQLNGSVPNRSIYLTHHQKRYSNDPLHQMVKSKSYIAPPYHQNTEQKVYQALRNNTKYQKNNPSSKSISNLTNFPSEFIDERVDLPASGANVEVSAIHQRSRSTPFHGFFV